MKDYDCVMSKKTSQDFESLLCYDQLMEDMLKEIKTRRSIRKYSDKPINKEVIRTLLRAGMQAPSAGNQQPWEFLVVEDKIELKKLSEVCPYSKMVEFAGCAIVLLNRTDNIRWPELVDQDMSACCQNILLEAVHQDLGAVWIGINNEQARMDYITKQFNLKSDIKPFSIVSIGHPDGKTNEFVDRFDEGRVVWV